MNKASLFFLFFLSDYKNRNNLIKILHEWAFGYVNNYSFKWKRRNNTPYTGDVWDLIYEIERYCSVNYKSSIIQEEIKNEER